MSSSNKEELVISQLLSQGEQLVYRYLKEESKKGTIRESMKDMAQNILHRYYDEIPSRNKGIEEEKTFSEATVHRAIRKMYAEGILVIVPSKEKSESNEIIFYGIPDEDTQVNEIINLGEKLAQSLSRMQRILLRKDQEIEQVKREREQLYMQLDELRREKENLLKKNQMLNKLLQEHLSGADISGKIIETETLPDGTIAIILQH